MFGATSIPDLQLKEQAGNPKERRKEEQKEQPTSVFSLRQPSNKERSTDGSKWISFRMITLYIFIQCAFISEMKGTNASLV